MKICFAVLFMPFVIAFTGLLVILILVTAAELIEAVIESLEYVRQWLDERKKK